MTEPTPDSVDVRPATPDDRLGASRVLDAAMLSVAALPERLASGHVLVAAGGSGSDERIHGAIVVAPEGPPHGSGSAASAGPAASGADDEAHDGDEETCDADGETSDADDEAPDADDEPPATGTGRPPADWQQYAHVTALAVRTRRRDRGIGTALVHAAHEQFGPLVADFDRRVRPFYESLDADVRPTGDDRCWALVDAATE